MSRVRLVIALLAVLALLVIPALVSAQGSNTLTVTLNTLNNSGQSGKATLTDMGNGQTKVDVAITGEPAGADEPMHIHNGQCGPTLGSVVYPLTDVISGTSTTTVSATLASLQTGNFAINGHQSKANIGTYVFCGNIPAAVSSSQAVTPTATAAAPSASATTTPTTLPTTGGSGGNSLLPVFVLGVLALGAGLLMRRYAR